MPGAEVTATVCVAVMRLRALFVVVTRVLKSEEVLRNISRDGSNCQEIFWRDRSHSRSHVMFGVEYDECLCGGVPAVWPHSPRWPTDAVAHWKKTPGECAVCGEACCSRECMLKLGRSHRKECEMVHENGCNIASILTLFEMKDALTPDEFNAATGGFFTTIASGARGSDSREGEKGASRVAVEGWNKVCGAPGCEKNSCAMKCSKCRVIYYCGKECQTKDWKAHKRVCAQMANGKVKPLES